jgi:hypothetical protein
MALWGGGVMEWRRCQALWSDHVGEENNRSSWDRRNYFVSADGYLMPTEKDQPPPELEGFNRPPQ